MNTRVAAGWQGIRGRFHAAFVGLLLALVVVAPARADLSAADADALRQSLRAIADGGWPNASVNLANDILIRRDYTEDDYRRFFASYFNARPLTDDLLVFLRYPSTYWFSDQSKERLRLQRALSRTSLALARRGLEAVSADSSSALLDADARSTLLNALKYLVRVGEAAQLSAEQRRAIAVDLAALAQERYPTLLRAAKWPDPVAKPWVPVMRSQFWMALVAQESLQRTAIADSLALSGKRRGLFVQQGVLVHDNGRFTAVELDATEKMLGAMFVSLGRPRHITAWDYLRPDRSAPNSLVSSMQFGSVNVFGIPVGARVENSFPLDVPGSTIDLFSAVLAHELNHIVDFITLERGNARGLRDRKRALISRAGNVPENYLRSMVLGGNRNFFLEAPQEFFASISNQWFDDSVQTLELGLVRADAGYLEPLNQFLFFADVYSRGGDTTRFYSVDAAGTLAFEDVPLERDDTGAITALEQGGVRYEFRYDADGFVSGYLER